MRTTTINFSNIACFIGILLVLVGLVPLTVTTLFVLVILLASNFSVTFR